MKPAPHISDIMVGPEIYSPVCFLPRVIPGQWPGVKDHAMGRGISHPGRQVPSGAYGPHACEYVFRSPPVRSFRTILKAVYHSWPHGHTCRVSLFYDRFNTKDLEA